MFLFFSFLRQDDGSAQSSPQDRYIRDLVARVKAGDIEAYDEIVSLFRDEIYALAWRLTRCADDAQDILR